MDRVCYQAFLRGVSTDVPINLSILNPLHVPLIPGVFWAGIGES